MTSVPDSVETFIQRWDGHEGGAERANYGMYLSELCDVIGVKRPDPARATTAENDYVFERAVKLTGPDGGTSIGRIDLYKRGCFVLEAKQSRLKGGSKALVAQGSKFTDADLSDKAPPAQGRESAASNVMMMNARNQAEAYAKALPADHGWPPFILVCDVGRVLEIRADFSGQGKNYAQFPDRQNFSVTLADLRRPEVRARLRLVWTDPLALDPARQTAKVTREIARTLAEISRALEAQKFAPERVAMFLMRCLFTMFAEDTGLLPEKSFKTLLEACAGTPDDFVPMVGQLWAAMDTGDYAFAIKRKVKKFNGAFFKNREVLPLKSAQIAALTVAAGFDWREVDPSIFGTLLEQALDVKERKSLGAHYTPRAYVERLVVATVIEPLRADWNQALATAERQQAEGRGKNAIATITAFHESLCKIRVLDPACGTGNFLYVSLELLKRLEGEVLEALNNFGGQEALTGLGGMSVDPHQFLGLEVNPRAAGIAELVLWIGYLQWHLRTKGGFPGEPILREFKNISVGDAVLDVSGAQPKRPKWPEAEFVVGNPPFIGSKFMRARLGDGYVKALWAANKKMNDSADFVMYWWDHAADLLVKKGSLLRRFGFVTTNSISQVFQRKVVERHLAAKTPISLVYAVPDHPWTKAQPDSAAVRIAMTVAEAGKQDGLLEETTLESALDTDAPVIFYAQQTGAINSDLTVGVDITKARALLGNEGICSPGVKLHGDGFIVTPEKAVALGLGKRQGLEPHIRLYRNGRDLTAHPRGVMVIDLFGLNIDAVRVRFAEVYQHLLETVKPERDQNNRASYKENWWIFGEPRTDLRHALKGLTRYIVTPVTQKHRFFCFLEADILPDDALMVIASDDAYILGVLQSISFTAWFKGNSSTLEDRPRFIKSRCFDPFPFPAATESQKTKIRVIAEELDALRKSVLADQENKLTLTGLYNVREAIRQKGVQGLNADEARIKDAGLVLILNELHDRLDAAVAAAYGWDVALPEEEILRGLVALNKERLAAEARGKVLWLRPDYQIPRFGSAVQKLDLAGEMRAAVPGIAARRAFPANEVAQTAEVMAVLAGAAAPLSAGDILHHFKPGKAVRPKVDAVLDGLVRMGIVNAGGTQFAIRRGGVARPSGMGAAAKNGGWRPAAPG
jgi:hypothetical protein